MKRLKTYKLFENSSLFMAEECLSVVKEMLKELDFLDISSNAVIRRSDGVLFIRITIWKPIDQRTLPKLWMKHEDMEKSLSQDDISSVVMTIKDYLLSEGWIIDDEKDLYNCGIWDGGSYLNLRTQYQIKFRNR